MKIQELNKKSKTNLLTLNNYRGEKKMFKFTFNEELKKVNQLCQDTIDILVTRTEDKIKKLVEDFEKFWGYEYQHQTKLSIGFIGQYNAGKSTLIKALTGNSTVKISAEICTDKVTEYSWQDVLLLDTPGIYAGNKEHDTITLEKISKCDLLVFVVPNELFNPQGAEFFQKVAKEMQRVGQMVLLVNKMSRESGQPDDLLSTIAQVIEPHHPDDFYTCFIDADSYLKAQDPKYKKYQTNLLAKSNFNYFLDSLQNLINKNELSARLVTPLHRAVDILDKSLIFLSTDDKRTRDLLELLRRKKIIIEASQIRARNAYHSELNKFEHEITMLAERIASKIDGNHQEEEITQEIAEVNKQINLLSEKTLENLQPILQSEVKRLISKLEELENSSLNQSLIEEIAMNLVDGKQVNNPNIRNTADKILLQQGGKFVQKVAEFSSTVSRDLVYNLGKSIGIKFKPFGAINTAKFIRGLGPLIAGAGVLLDVAITAKEQHEYAEFQRKLQQYRTEIRKELRELAEKMRKDYEFNIEQALVIYNEELDVIDTKQKDLRNFDQSRLDILTQIDSKRQEIKQEIRRLLKY